MCVASYHVTGALHLDPRKVGHNLRCSSAHAVVQHPRHQRGVVEGHLTGPLQVARPGPVTRV